MQVVEIANHNGLRALVADYGARLVQLWVPDREGVLGDVVLGFDDIASYRAARTTYLGCTVGRVANRIAAGRFTLDGVVHELPRNEPPNHLHGGGEGAFDDRTWEIDRSATGDRVSLRLVSPSGELGYPGTVHAQVSYTLTPDDALVVDFEATTDEATPVSLTNHAYWNLGGRPSAEDGIRNHVLWVNASRYTPVDAELIPTGAIELVDGTALDFRAPTSIGARLAALSETPARGYDHNLVLDTDSAHDGVATLVARLFDPQSGRVLELATTEPALQLYTGQLLPSLVGKRGERYGPFAGLCLEPQGFPDAVNRPAFPSVILRPGSVYRHRIAYRFLTEG